MTLVEDVLLRWVVTVLFGLGAIDSITALIRRRGDRHYEIAHSLFLVMAVAMIVMAWPIGLRLPGVPPLVFFAGATVVLAVIAARTLMARRFYVYASLTMGSMVWMYAVMSRHSLASSGADGPSASHHLGADDAVAEMASMHGATSSPGWMSPLNLLIVLAFLVATLVCTGKFVAAMWAAPRIRRSQAVSFTRRWQREIGWLCHGCMAAAMGIMFATLL